MRRKKTEDRLRTAERNYRLFHNYSDTYWGFTANLNSLFHEIGNTAHTPLPSDLAAFFGNSTPWFYPGYNQATPPSNFGPPISPNPIAGSAP